MPKPTFPKPSPKTTVLVVDRDNTGVPNFPSTSKQAEEGITQVLSELAKLGWHYSGTIPKAVGPVLKDFLVFYPAPKVPKVVQEVKE